jgi:hypothetical protein
MLLPNLSDCEHSPLLIWLKIEALESRKKRMDNVKELISNLFAQKRVTGKLGTQREAKFTTPFAECYMTCPNVKPHFDGRSSN